jgi:histidyl-tRNA synthetase
VRIKEMGLPADHPLKEGELISLDKLEAEAQQRLSLKKQVDSIARQAAGLRVVHGIKGDEVKASAASGTAKTTEQPAAAAAAASEVEEKKPAEGEGGSS